ncbi:MAG: hypothetical protein MJ231_04955 [bacterium]|nr:hypothetical protein [bacterium]
MIEGLLVPPMRDLDFLTPSAPYPLTQSGLDVGQSAIYRYSIPTDEQPTLTIVDYIPDYNGNFIKPGHYELALSNDKEFLYLIESKDLIAVIPVFKLAENQSELKKYRDNLTKSEKKELKKEERAKKRKAKIQKVIDAKYAKTGATEPKKEYLHMEASIDYIKEGGYYLIRYEKGFIRAWGAIKAVN